MSVGTGQVGLHKFGRTPCIEQINSAGSTSRIVAGPEAMLACLGAIGAQSCKCQCGGWTLSFVYANGNLNTLETVPNALAASSECGVLRNRDSTSGG